MWPFCILSLTWGPLRNKWKSDEGERMTASKTSRLGLMNPVGSDAFVTSDFSQTFGILDQNPGVLPVANAAARPTSYGTAQHGSLVYQTDLGIMLAWNQPNSGVTGQWVRVGTAGYLGISQNSGTVSTSTTAYANGPTVLSGTVTVPGGRPYLVLISWDRLDNQYGRSVVSYWENNVRIVDKAVYGWTGDFTDRVLWFYRAAPSAATALTVKLTLAAYNAAPSNGGGTSTIGNAILALIEV